MFSYSLMQGALKNIENINTDHRHWFSPFTLQKLLCDTKFEITGFYLINGFWGPFYCNLKQRIINRLFALLGKKRHYKKVKNLCFAKGFLIVAK
jgi:hypothetical protein